MAKKKRNIKSQPRFSMSTIEISNEDINPNTGNVEVDIKFDLCQNTAEVINNYTGNSIGSKTLAKGYKGENKWRVTAEISTEKGDNGLCICNKIGKYKHLLAIDTNLRKCYSKILDKEIWMGYGFAVALLEDNNGQFLQPLYNTPFDTSICPQKPENENWIRLIEMLKNICKCEDERKIGIVVDSDLDNIPAFNKREKPILGNYFLPDGFELIFASDKVTDNVFNRMIKLSHKISKEFTPMFIDNFLKEEEKRFNDNSNRKNI